jgi:hypothetical protein
MMDNTMTIEEVLEALSKSESHPQDELNRLNGHIDGFIQAAYHYLSGRRPTRIEHRPDYWERGYNTFVTVMESDL